MAAVQVWFYGGLIGDGPILKEPPLGYQSETVSTSNVEFTKPGGATIAVIETDAQIAYRVNGAAVYADDPNIGATALNRYVVDVGAGNLNIIAGA